MIAVSRCFSALLVLLCAAVQVAHSAPSRVVVLRAAGAGPAAKRVDLLLVAELRSAGFDVVSVDADAPTPRTELRLQLESVALDKSPIATLALVPIEAAPSGTGASGAAGEFAFEAWISDRMTGKVVVRRLVAAPNSPQPAADVALAAVELLRGSLMEFVVKAKSGPTVIAQAEQAPADVTRFVGDASIGDSRHALSGVGVSVGALVLGGLSGANAPWVFSPVFRLSFGFSSGPAAGLSLRASLAAPTTIAEKSAEGGTARVGQMLGGLDALWVFRPQKIIQPFVAAGAGLHHVWAEGKGITELFVSRDGSRWRPALLAGGGLLLALASRVSLSLDVQAAAILPATAIVVSREEVIRVGGLSLLGGLSLGATF